MMNFSKHNITIDYDKLDFTYLVIDKLANNFIIMANTASDYYLHKFAWLDWNYNHNMNDDSDIFIGDLNRFRYPKYIEIIDDRYYERYDEKNMISYIRKKLQKTVGIKYIVEEKMDSFSINVEYMQKCNYYIYSYENKNMYVPVHYYITKDYSTYLSFFSDFTSNKYTYSNIINFKNNVPNNYEMHRLIQMRTTPMYNINIIDNFDRYCNILDNDFLIEDTNNNHNVTRYIGTIFMFIKYELKKKNNWKCYFCDLYGDSILSDNIKESEQRIQSACNKNSEKYWCLTKCCDNLLCITCLKNKCITEPTNDCTICGKTNYGFMKLSRDNNKYIHPDLAKH